MSSSTSVLVQFLPAHRCAQVYGFQSLWDHRYWIRKDKSCRIRWALRVAHTHGLKFGGGCGCQDWPSMTPNDVTVWQGGTCATRIGILENSNLRDQNSGTVKHMDLGSSILGVRIPAAPDSSQARLDRPDLYRWHFV